MLLTKEHIKGFKEATAIVFRYYYKLSRIEVIKEVKDKVFGQSELRFEIPVNTQLRGKDSSSIVSCCESFHYLKSQQELQTIFSLLRPNDELTLIWDKDYATNDYCSSARSECSGGEGMSIHVDVLRLKIKRGEKVMLFNIDVSACVNNSARMIQG